MSKIGTHRSQEAEFPQMRVEGDKPEWQQQYAEEQLDITVMLKAERLGAPNSPDAVSGDQES